jgi:hypothetical protein
MALKDQKTTASNRETAVSISDASNKRNYKPNWAAAV